MSRCFPLSPYYYSQFVYAWHALSVCVYISPACLARTIVLAIQINAVKAVCPYLTNRQLETVETAVFSQGYQE